MNRKLRALIGILVVAGAIAACNTGGGPMSSRRPATELRLTAQRDAQIDGQPVQFPSALSPDGRWLAAFGPQRRQLCIYAVDTLTEKHCAELDRGPVSTAFAWSPDSRHIALTEDWRKDFIRSDLWLLNAESGQLTQLTDDDNALDVFPVWSPDNQSLLFQRVTASGETALYRVASSGGSPKKVLASDSLFGSQMIWSSNGQIVFTTPSDGLWVTDTDGQNLRQVLKRDSELGPPMLMAVSPKGDTALIIYLVAGRGDFFSQGNVSYCVIVDLNTGETQPLKRATGAAIEFYGPMDATYSPDGAKILYTYRTADNQARLVVREVNGAAENILFTYDNPELFRGLGLNLTWAQNDLIYLPQTHLFLSVGAK